MVRILSYFYYYLILLLLLQATSLASDIVQGSTPILAKVLKKVAQIQQSPFLKDQDAALHEIAMAHGLVSSTVTKKKKTKKGKENTSASSSATDDPAETATKAVPPPNFSFIVTRPTVLLRDGPSSRKLSASRSVRAIEYYRLISIVHPLLLLYWRWLTPFLFELQQPGPFPIANIDLAEFTLNALRNEKLFNTCPYVVADSF